MTSKLAERDIALLREPHLAQFVTLMQDGSPHVAPVWVDTDGTNVLINSEEGRVKVRNISRDPRVAVGVYDPARPYERVLNVRGTVIEVTKEGAREHIDALAKKYTGADVYPAHNPDKSRLIIKIRPDHVYGG